MNKKILVTVGSTHFDELIEIIDSEEFINFSKSIGFTEIFAQIGKYEKKIKNLKNYSSYVKPGEMKKLFNESDLIIGHAGAGTILEVLQIGKPLIVVVNDNLMENHQTELASKLLSLNLLEMFSVSNFFEGFKNSKFISNKIKMNMNEIINEINNHFNFQIKN